jgi:hypothetical protein
LYRRLVGPQGPVWTGAENLGSTGIRSPDRRARSESLQREVQWQWLTVSFLTRDWGLTYVWHNGQVTRCATRTSVPPYCPS